MLTPAGSNEADLAALIPGGSRSGPTSAPSGSKSGFTEAELAVANAQHTPQSKPKGPHPSPSDSLPSSPAIARPAREKQKRTFEDIQEEEDETQAGDEAKRAKLQSEGQIGGGGNTQQKSEGKKRLLEEMGEGDQGSADEAKDGGSQKRLFQGDSEGAQGSTGSSGEAAEDKNSE